VKNRLKIQFHLKKIPRAFKIILVFLLVFTIIIVGFYIVYFSKNKISYDVSDWANLGDYIGGILGPLFAGASFIVLILTLLLQMEELKLQREELADQRKVMNLQREEMEGQKKALQYQNININRQIFETSFFSLLNRQQQIVESIIYGSGDGKAAINEMVIILQRHYQRFILYYIITDS